MKLFKSLLIAPATLGLLAPMTATANEVTISDFTPAEQLAITNSRVDGLEARMNNIEAGSFSETTTASFGATFYAGIAYDDDGGNDRDDNLSTGYDFGIDLTTSFTGEDSLDIEIDAGNADAPGVAELDGDTTTNEALTVDEITYTFPLGEKTTVMIGDNNDASALFTTACVYGGPSNTLDDCGNVNAGITNGGAMAGASYDFGNGFTAAIGYAGAETGIMTLETTDAIGANVAYSADNYGVSVTYGSIEAGTNGVKQNVYTALNGYYSFDSGLNVSAGYEYGDIGGNAANADESINYFVGVNGEVGTGELGAALGTAGGQLENQTEELMYEAYYSYPVNDGMTVTPLIYIKEKATAGTPDETGVMVKTSFSF